MNPHMLKRLLPQASASTIAANSADFGSGVPEEAPRLAPESFSTQKQPDDHHPETQIQDAKSPQSTASLDADRAGEAPGTGRPAVCFTLRRVRLLDTDAKHGSCKDLLDGLQYAGLIRGDREDQITLEVTQEKVAHRKDEETVIKIQYP